MTLNEFKAWLEGFEEAMGGNPPSAEQWASIKAKLAKVDIVRPAAYRDTQEPWPKVRYGSSTDARAVFTKEELRKAEDMDDVLPGGHPAPRRRWL